MNVHSRRSVSMGELHGGYGLPRREETETSILERTKSSRHLTKKKSFRMGSNYQDRGRNLSRKPSIRSLTNLMHKLVVRLSSFPNTSVYLDSTTSANSVAIDDNASYKMKIRDGGDEEKSRSDSLPEIRRSRSVDSLGRLGLKNHGNTCFMNAVVQCLSHTDLLAEYFVMDQYKIDLKQRKGQTRKFGTKGEVTEKLAVLLKSMWSNQYSAQISSEFKAVVGKHGVQYRGCSQHDAQEFLLWLLDKVHEDLNRATKRKYKAMKESYGRADELVAHDALANHLRCNNSFVLDLFQAQYRSSLTCPRCQQHSTTFDPFMCLSLPIPQRETRPIAITVVFVNSSRVPLRIGITVKISGTICNLRDAIADMTLIPQTSLIITELYCDGFHRTFSDKQSLTAIHDGDNIYAFEVPHALFPADGSGANSPPIVLSADNGPIQDTVVILFANCQGFGKNSKRFGPPFILRVLRELSYAELQKTLLRAMCKLLTGAELRRPAVLFKLRVVNGLAGKRYLSDEVDHPLYQATVDSALMSCTQGSGPQHIKICAEWEPESRASYVKNVSSEKPEEHCSMREVEMLHNEAHKVALEDCLALYTKQEELGPDDAWHCPRCKKLQQGTVKRLSLWTLPEVLVIHLKRFKLSATGRSKLHTLVNFPLTGLDMTPHQEPHTRKHGSHDNSTGHGWGTWRRHRASSVTTSEENLYDLYAVCNHLGNMSGGHYTAFCKNPIDGQWNVFDDTYVEQISEEGVTTRAAYLLFYARRNVGSSSASVSSESTASSDHWIHRMPHFSYESIADPREEQGKPDDKTAGTECSKPPALTQEQSRSAADRWRSGTNTFVVTESCV